MAEDDDSVSHFDPPQQVIATLDKNPSRRDGFVDRRINHPSLENSFCSDSWRRHSQDQQKQPTSPKHSWERSAHNISDAGALPPGVHPNRNTRVPNA